MCKECGMAYSLSAKRMDERQFFVNGGPYAEVVEMGDPDDGATCTCGAAMRMVTWSRGVGFCEHIWAARRAYYAEVKEATK